jgi:hypothetical protein
MSLQLQRRVGDCPLGGVYYKCDANNGGFSGCCLDNPCFQSGFCPKDKDRTPDWGTLSST